MALSLELAEYLADSLPEDVTQRDRTEVGLAFVDDVGVLIAGAASPLAQITTARAARHASAVEATILAANFRTAAPKAALVNATAAHALDYDDTAGYGHPTSALFAAILAASELRGEVSGPEVVSAYCNGFNIGTALRSAGQYDQAERGLHNTSLFGTIAAAAAAARVLCLDVRQTAAALSIAASGSCGLVANFGSMTKPLHMGLAARNGLTSALLAGAGFQAAYDVFEGAGGFLETFFGRHSYATELVRRHLAARASVADARMTKKWPCCGSNHSAIDAVLKVMNENSISYEDILAVDVLNFSPTSPPGRFSIPQDPLQAKFSLRYAVAAAIRDHGVRHEHFTQECITTAAMNEAMAKVRVHFKANPAGKGIHTDIASDAGNLRIGEANPVQLTLRDGRQLTARISRGEMSGSPGNPLSTSQITAKFRENAAEGGLNKAAADQLIELWINIQSATNVVSILRHSAELISGTPRRTA